MVYSVWRERRRGKRPHRERRGIGGEGEEELGI